MKAATMILKKVATIVGAILIFGAQTYVAKDEREFVHDAQAGQMALK